MLDRLRGLMTVLWREVLKFGVVGAVAFVVDLGGFNLLASGPLHGHPTRAKVVSGAVATVVAWVGNRWWTFRHRRNRAVGHEVVLFFLVNGLALALAAAWMAFTHGVLGMEGRVALNVNAFVGIGLGTLLRFWAYRRFVFSGDPDLASPPAGPQRRGGAPSGVEELHPEPVPCSDRKSANRAG